MTPLPPTFTEETKRLLKEKFAPFIAFRTSNHSMHFGTEADVGVAQLEHCEDALQDFTHSRESAAYELGRAETLKEVREMCEGMKIDNIEIAIRFGQHDYIEKQRTYNLALSDLITRLTK